MMLRRGYGVVEKSCRRFHQLHAAGSAGQQRRCCSSAARTAQGQALAAVAPTESSLQHLADLLASVARRGDCICLYGRVGAGKSVFRCAPGLFEGPAH
jgi:hypothetical protein